MPFHLLKYEYFLVSLVVYDTKLSIFGFWSGQNKIFEVASCVLGNCYFHHFLTF